MADGLRHAILGAGGVGGLMGACLAHSGSCVTMIVRRDSIAKYPRQINLQSPFGNMTADVDVAGEVPACDALWLSTKATQLDSALTALRNPEAVGAIVPLLNGVDHVSMLRAKYGADTIIPATIAVESERVSPGQIIHRTPFARLNILSSGESLLGTTLNDLRAIGFECRFIADEATLMWSKLVFLAPFALTTSAADRTTGAVIADPEWRVKLESCVREASAVACAEGAKVNADAVISAMLKMPPDMRSSMQKDVSQGNPPELDAIAGAILRGASRHGIDLPTTSTLVAAVLRRAGVTRVSD